MAAICPSDVISILVTDYPWARGLSQAPNFFDPANDSYKLAGLLDLLDRIPEALLPQVCDDYSAYTQIVAALRQVLKQAERGGSISWPSVRKNNALTALWLLLTKCPDEVILGGTAGLEFISDEKLRNSIRLDLSAAESTLNNGEWKASTVLSGAALEALLLWKIDVANVDERESAKAKAAKRVGQRQRLVVDKPENWSLADYIEMAFAMGAITEQCVEQARLAKDYRNLIHPGKEMRERLKCDRGTAHGAFAAVQFAVRDLAERLA